MDKEQIVDHMFIRAAAAIGCDPGFLSVMKKQGYIRFEEVYPIIPYILRQEFGNLPQLHDRFGDTNEITSSILNEKRTGIRLLLTEALNQAVNRGQISEVEKRGYLNATRNFESTNLLTNLSPEATAQIKESLAIKFLEAEERSSDYFITAAKAIAENPDFLRNLESDGYANIGKFNNVYPAALESEFGLAPDIHSIYGQNMIPTALLMEESIKQAAEKQLISYKARDKYLAQTHEKYPHIFKDSDSIQQNVIGSIAMAGEIQLHPNITPDKREEMLKKLDEKYPTLQADLAAHPSLTSLPDKETYIQTIALNTMQFNEDRNRGFKQRIAGEVATIVQTTPATTIGNETIGFIETSAALEMLRTR